MTTTEQHFPKDVSSVPLVRQFVREHVGAPQQGDVAALLVTELASNAVRHARSDFVVVLEVSESHLRVEVHDTSSDTPSLQSAAAEDTGGRGLSVVNALANDWGVSWQGEGKSVWFELGTDETPPAA